MLLIYERALLYLWAPLLRPSDLPFRASMKINLCAIGGIILTREGQITQNTIIIQFKTKNKPIPDINIACDNKSITPATDIKFLGIYLQDSINWSCHIDYIIPKLSFSMLCNEEC